jgi:hypothetical protein
MAGLVLVLLAPGLLLGLALTVIEVRTIYGGCPTRRRYVWRHAAGGARAGVPSYGRVVRAGPPGRR